MGTLRVKSRKTQNSVLFNVLNSLSEANYATLIYTWKLIKINIFLAKKLLNGFR